jgi:hypothetical protein
LRFDFIEDFCRPIVRFVSASCHATASIPPMRASGNSARFASSIARSKSPARAM